MISERLRRIRHIAEFVVERSGDYVELAGIELSLFRSALVTTMIGGVALLFCTLGTLAFISVGAIVTFWDTEHRTLAAWAVAGAWLLITLIALVVVTRNAPKSSPFAELSRQVRLDTATVRSQHDQDRPSS
ncbi:MULTISPECIES: phage holin family protein [unclassified Bordetella]|uniref:phage holin family protein n=1 Tax=unclassified Bordetella TaxID=2630031 RepID=UPI0013268750|nr:MULTISPECIES: phage holin family protein [unclassified Bordetella]MVW71012.1 phage holin family protein [Bordetella sp. 15P40C-2]MVW80581.1 phage holin family protein [Bordetella sp. 02P26C-1]